MSVNLRLQKLNRSSSDGPLRLRQLGPEYCGGASLQEVEDHGVVVAFGTVPPHKGDSNTTGERLVHLGLIFELGVLGLDRLELDGDLLARDDVDTEVDVTWDTLVDVLDRWCWKYERLTERATSDLLADPVLASYSEIHGRHSGRGNPIGHFVRLWIRREEAAAGRAYIGGNGDDRFGV